MKRFLITSHAYEGEAELIYDASGRLVTLNVLNTNMDTLQIDSMMLYAPSDIKNIGTAFQKTTATILAVDFDISVDDFLKVYPYARNTHLVKEYWPKMDKTAQVLSYYAAIEYAKYCKRNKWYNPKIAAAWLKGKEYLNEWRKM